MCYLQGTHIQTPGGEIAVEDLQIGDLVVTALGAERPIKWIGRRSYVTRFLPQQGRRGVLPIRFDQGSLGEQLPKRDLCVSPEHCLSLEGGLVPARHLVNGLSIRYVETFATFEYYHIELQIHDILIAEGVAAESWLDCGNRNFFKNVIAYAALGLAEEQPRHKPCLPMIGDPEVLARLCNSFSERAIKAGYETTTDPDLHLLADGRRVDFTSAENNVYWFELAEIPKSLVIGSRSAVPAEMNPSSLDHRKLGAGVKRFVFESSGIKMLISHDHPLLAAGFHAAELHHRWTSGMASIPSQFLACLSKGVQLEVHLVTSALRYVKPLAAAHCAGRSDLPPSDQPAAKREAGDTRLVDLRVFED